MYCLLRVETTLKQKLKYVTPPPLYSLLYSTWFTTQHSIDINIIKHYKHYFNLINWNFPLSASITRCPLYRQYFQKILSYRPIITTEIGPSSKLINSNNQQLLAINVDCWAKCKQDIECSGYVLFFNSTECYGFTKYEKSNKYYIPINSDTLEQDSNAVYFEKICLNNGKYQICFSLNVLWRLVYK